jgi:flavin reductase (DIM6/NTAB) family NADH-FMN oxidoreductase RutF
MTMARIPIEPLENAYRLLNPGAVVLVTVGDGERDNLFPVTWNMPVRKQPGMVALLSGKSHFSYPFFEETGQFGLNLPHAPLVDAVLGCGRTSGRKVADKFGRFGLTRERSAVIHAPLVAECVGSLECEVEQIVDLGKSSIVLGRIVAAVADETHFVDGHLTFDHGLELLHHLSGERFALSTRAVRGRPPAP